jgi:hypothetical protein
VHVDRLNRHQRAQLFRRLDDDLRDEPRVDELVVRVDEDAPIAGAIAPRRDIGHPAAIDVRGQILGLWTGGEELEHAHSRRQLLVPIALDVAPTRLGVQLRAVHSHRLKR